MAPSSATPSEPLPEVVDEAVAEVAAPPRQRWRLILARDAGAPALTGRDLMEAWEATLGSSGLPLVRPTGRARARIAFGAPLPASMVLEHELADIVLTEFVPAWQVRETLSGQLPDGWRLIDLHDVWLGAPALAGQVAAADYRIDLGEADAAAVALAAERLLAATALPRERLKGNGTVTYDLRPLVVDVLVADPGPPVLVRARTLFHPALGTGRPEEVVAAMAELADRSLEARSVVRERLILAEDLDPHPG